VTRSVRVAFLGNDAWSVPSLREFAASRHRVVAVVTATPRPARRGSRPSPTPVAEAARALGLPLAQVETVVRGSGFDRLAAAAPDVLAVVAYGELLPAAVLELPTIAPVNLHFSLLPALRGASPVQTALLLGLDRTGVSTMLMDVGLDTGPVLRQREVPVLADDDAGTLGARLAEIGAEELTASVDELVEGTATPRSQDDALATFAPKIRAADRVLDWSSPTRAVVDRCRALAPEPGATTTFRGVVLKVFRAQAAAGDGEPGRIVEVARDGVVVATSDGAVRLLDVAPAGRKRMSGADLAHGLHPLVGERLGEP
jgi:methionyl-tRNA formyltransferase